MAEVDRGKRSDGGAGESCWKRSEGRGLLPMLMLVLLPVWQILAAVAFMSPALVLVLVTALAGSLPLPRATSTSCTTERSSGARTHCRR